MVKVGGWRVACGMMEGRWNGEGGRVESGLRRSAEVGLRGWRGEGWRVDACRCEGGGWTVGVSMGAKKSGVIGFMI